MHFLVCNALNNRRTIVKEILWSSLGPLRIIELIFAVGILVPLSWQITSDIFNGGIWVLICANVGFVMFTERDTLKKGRLNWFVSVATFSLAMIAIESTGIFVHTATVFMHDSSVAKYYETVSLAFIGAGYGYTVLHAFMRRFYDKEISDDKAMILFVLIIMALAGLFWVDYQKNPYDPVKTLVNWIFTLQLH